MSKARALLLPSLAPPRVLRLCLRCRRAARHAAARWAQWRVQGGRLRRRWTLTCRLTQCSGELMASCCQWTPQLPAGTLCWAQALSCWAPVSRAAQRAVHGGRASHSAAQRRRRARAWRQTTTVRASARVGLPLSAGLTAPRGCRSGWKPRRSGQEERQEAEEGGCRFRVLRGRGAQRLSLIHI
jgi:hypothetical protein